MYEPSPSVRPHLSVHSDHLPDPDGVKVELTLRDSYAVLSLRPASGVEVMLFTPALSYEQACEWLESLSLQAHAARLAL